MVFKSNRGNDVVDVERARRHRSRVQARLRVAARLEHVNRDKRKRRFDVVGDVADHELPVLAPQGVEDDGLQLSSFVFELGVQIEAGDERIGLYPQADTVRIIR